MKKMNLPNAGKLHLLAGVAALAFLAANASGQSLQQTFEPGEDTSDWGSSWVGPSGFSTAAPGFLDPALGGTQSGFASSQFGQEASRDFRSNTVGLDTHTDSYSVSMYVQLSLDAGSTPASGYFYILDGTFGDYTANIRLTYNNGSGSELDAYGNNGWQPLNVNLDLSNPYLIQFTVDPTAATYSTTVSEVTTSGSVLSSASLTDLAITGNAINNNNNGQLLFHIEGSAGYVNMNMDNINITPASAPEPSSAALILVALGAFMWIKYRPAHSLAPISWRGGHRLKSQPAEKIE
jgi:hypothetical protein